MASAGAGVCGVGSVRGKVCFITGGASGLGLGAAQHLIKQGATCVIYDLPSSQGNKVAQGLGERCKFIEGDVCSEVEVKRALEQAWSEFGRIDACVSNAGVFQRSFQPIYDFHTDTPFPLEELRRCLEVNVIGMFNVVRLAAGVIGRNKPNGNGERGVIILTGSCSGRPHVIQPTMMAYSTSKAAVNGMTANLAGDLYSHGIRVVTIAPASFESNLLDRTDVEEIPRIVMDMRSNVFPARLGESERDFGQCVQMCVENVLLNGSIISLDGMSRYNLPVPSTSRTPA